MGMREEGNTLRRLILVLKIMLTKFNSQGKHIQDMRMLRTDTEGKEE